MRAYELAVILHPDLEIDLGSTTSKLVKLIEDNGGKITGTDDWGKRKLAYVIKKQEFGIYIFYQLGIDPQKIAGLEQTLRLSNEILRFLVIKLPTVSGKTQAPKKTRARASKAVKKVASKATKVDNEKTVTVDKTQPKPKS
ncbi:30S ribosomal protein S6 [Candidatus Microgenomates bacterium]|nr:30S ribosomal protein S6 [Candidatus Microgenomates bacterium]